ncbi:MAG: methionyl-tRNA formyltransferase [Ignavibacteria bacterium]|nr:methionyl-tRNA formyltransferase [Ignavibacteria bacterium]
MRIVFFGTPSIAVRCLEKLQESGKNIVAVVTVTDKEQGRGKKILPSPVKEFALQNSIPVLQPESLKSEEFFSDLRALNADLFIVVAFKILPRSIFSMPKYGSFNLHGSLLPKYRGAAPIQWAIINGDEVTGLTTFALADKVDTGNIYLMKSVVIEPEDNFGSLYEKMSATGAEMVLETVEMIESGNYTLLPQNDELATPAPKITKETCQIDFNNSAINIHNLVRGLSPSPGAFFIHDGKHFKVFRTSPADMTLSPGQFTTTKHQIFVGTGQGALEILEIQPEGKKRMKADEFLRGYKL